MSKYSKYSLTFPTQARPKPGDEIRIKAKLKPRPQEFFINLGINKVNDSKSENEEPEMIAFHFKTTFRHHHSRTSKVKLSHKRGEDDTNWLDVEEFENTWIDDDVEDIDVAIRFTSRDIQFFSGGSAEYTFDHKFQMDQINRLQLGGDLEFVEEVALRYSRGN